METITIPSPSAFLQSPDSDPSTPPIAPKSASKKKLTTSRTHKSSNTRADGITKPKQSKSRNGCVTCKAKRLKCDETKPACQQCDKRQVKCGGYKKDFKWRSFEEATFTGKPAVPKTKKASVSIKSDQLPPESPATSDESGSTTGPFSAQSPPCPPFVEFSPQPTAAQLQYPYYSNSSNGFTIEQSLYPQTQKRFDMVPQEYQQSGPLNFGTTINGTIYNDVGQAQPSISTTSSHSSGQSPRLVDLLNPGTDLNSPRDFLYHLPQQSDIPYQPGGYPPLKQVTFDDGDDVEEIIRQTDPTAANGLIRSPSPSPSSSSSSSSNNSGLEITNFVYNQPKLHPGSPEMLMLGFDKQTCGILSVKDGPTENPWRTLILPLINQSSALYHAISSMTAFHKSKTDAKMKMKGVDHMRQSVQSLRSELREDENTNTALATTLVLAFAESWDVHVSTGIEHLRGAKVLMKQALTKHQQNILSNEDVLRLKFLCNTWVYMDVIARLTSVDDDESNDFDAALWLTPGPFMASAEIDPLMGCASTLFPLIGRVANLVRRVRKSARNSFNIISQANDLKTQIENWEPPIFVEAPQDPTSEIQHSLQTAEAYRWATLLYLHQAVPEIPSRSAAELANEVLVYLATVPLNSRVIIVHIYPLLAAGCECTSNEDRTWVSDRWKAMSSRMLIGNIDRCLEVVREVWARRDERELEMAQEYQRRLASRNHYNHTSPVLSMKRALSAEEQDTMTFMERPSGIRSLKRHATIGDTGLPEPVRVHHPKRPSMDRLEQFEFEKTVRGRLHWVGVMKDWNWEVLLG